MSDIFREIDEELRRDNLLKLWSRYGSYIVAVAVARAGRRRHRGVARPSAIRAPRRSRRAMPRHCPWPARARSAEAAKVFAAVSRRKAADTPSSPPSRRPSCWPNRAIARARLRPTTGSPRRPALDPEFRDLAVLLSVMHALPDADPQAAIDRSAPMTAPATRGAPRPSS